MAKAKTPVLKPPDIVAGNIANLMHRRRVSCEDIALLCGYHDARPLRARMDNPGSFSLDELSMICSFFGVTMEQLVRDNFTES